ncbi:MAG: histidinol-phosphate aminotransferase [Gammaproteobacteria bacterium]
MDPYGPGEQPGNRVFKKLNTNENPYPPAPGVKTAIEQFNANDLKLYPDPESVELRQALADYHHLDVNQLFVGNGSDEVLAHAFFAFFQQTHPLLFPDISYSFYPVYCGLYGIEFNTIKLNTRFEIDIEDYSNPYGGIILPNPNAPTGIALPLESIRRLLVNSRSVVIIDEAYVDFGAESAISLINEFEHLLVIRTFSKSRSLAGLRLGYAMGSSALINGLNRVKNSFNSYPVNRLTTRIAIASIEDEDYFKQSCDLIINSRESLSKNLKTLGFAVFPSKSNFLFVHHPGQNALVLAGKLRDIGILVRHFKADRIDQCLRITVGNESECEALFSALTVIVNGGD